MQVLFFVINYPDTRKFNGLKLRILTIKFVLINEGELNRKKKSKKEASHTDLIKKRPEKVSEK